MSELKALVPILVLASAVFSFARQPACLLAMAPQDFARRRNLWIAVTLAAFLAHSFWLYLAIAALLLFLARPREPNALALFFSLLFAVPALSADIPGMGIVRYFFSVSHGTLLLLIILLPAAFTLIQASDTLRIGRMLPDKLLLGYLLLSLIIQFGADSPTNTLRSAFYSFIGVVVPYFVASRSLRDIERFRDAIMSFVVASMVLAALAVFEASRHWLLYASLADLLGVLNTGGGYLERSGSLRAQVTTDQPIPLGYILAVALGMHMFLRKSIPDRVVWSLGLALLAAGLIASLSRGPWVGFAVILMVQIATGPKATANFMRLGALALVGVPLLLVLPGGATLIDYLPFVGSIEEGNITYRTLLIENAMQVIENNPLFGSYDFMLYLEDLRQGQGIIDIVNTYIGVALTSGLVGLTLFLSFFLSIGAALRNALWRYPEKDSELHLLGRSLLAVLIGILVIIFTVSSISFIATVYWCVAGLCVACTRIILREIEHMSPDALKRGPTRWGRVTGVTVAGRTIA